MNSLMVRPIDSSDYTLRSSLEYMYLMVAYNAVDWDKDLKRFVNNNLPSKPCYMSVKLHYSVTRLYLSAYSVISDIK